MKISKFLIVAAVVAVFIWQCSNGSKTTVHTEIPEWLRGSWHRVGQEFDDSDTGIKSIKFFSHGFEEKYLEDGKELTYRHGIDKVKVIAPEDMRYGEVDIQYNLKKSNLPDVPHVLNISFSDKKETVTISIISPSGMNDGSGPLPEENWYTIGEFSLN